MRALIGNIKGPKGPKGDTGAKGAQGIQGPQGPAGPTGAVDKDTAITFSQAVERKNIISGESIATVFGKAMKFFADLKTVAFSGKYTDLTDTPTALKNPKALTFTGGVTGSYDGSAEKSVAIPSVTNNFMATVPGTAFDAVRGKELKDENIQIKADLAEINSNLTEKTVVFDETKEFSSQIKFAGFGQSYYVIKSGWCWLHVVMLVMTDSVVGESIGFNVPTCVHLVRGDFIPTSNREGSPLQAVIKSGKMSFLYGAKGCVYAVNFLYPTTDK